MNDKIVIGIIGEERIYDNHLLIVINDKILDVILKYDAIPLGILPTNINSSSKLNEDEKQKLYKELDLCNGVILQGGFNIFDYHLEAIKYIREKDIPVLGICLGMQIMALSSSGVKKSISDNSHKQDKDAAHYIEINKDSILYSILKEEKMLVNSRHYCTVENFNDYLVSARSSNDNIIEAIELPDKCFHIGVQWHPEDLLNNKLFEVFFNTVKNRK